MHVLRVDFKMVEKVIVYYKINATKVILMDGMGSEINVIQSHGNTSFDLWVEVEEALSLLMPAMRLRRFKYIFKEITRS